MNLNPSNFDNIQDFFTKLNSLRLQLSNCGVTKEDEQLILSGPDYSVFVSTLQATMDALGNAYKMPSLDGFAAQLTREQSKLAHMGKLKSSTSQALLAKDPKASSGKGKKQNKDPKYNEQGKKQNKNHKSNEQDKDLPSQSTLEFTSSSKEESYKRS